jgi:RimJ/RimL family protein N-acetyltransferase
MDSQPTTTPDGQPLLVVGTRAALGPLRRDLLEHYTRWMNDPVTMRGVARRRPLTLDAETAWYERAAADTGTAAHFTVYDRDDLAPVGTTGLSAIDHANGTAEFGIMLGERRGRGIGTDATRLTLDWAFGELGLHNVMLRVFAWNERARHAYLAAGFSEIGRRRAAAVTRDGRADVVFMDVLASEQAGGAQPKPAT